MRDRNWITRDGIIHAASAFILRPIFWRQDADRGVHRSIGRCADERWLAGGSFFAALLCGLDRGPKRFSSSASGYMKTCLRCWWARGQQERREMVAMDGWRQLRSQLNGGEKIDVQHGRAMSGMRGHLDWCMMSSSA